MTGLWEIFRLEKYFKALKCFFALFIFYLCTYIHAKLLTRKSEIFLFNFYSKTYLIYYEFIYDCIHFFMYLITNCVHIYLSLYLLSCLFRELPSLQHKLSRILYEVQVKNITGRVARQVGHPTTHRCAGTSLQASYH